MFEDKWRNVDEMLQEEYEIRLIVRTKIQLKERQWICLTEILKFGAIA